MECAQNEISQPCQHNKYFVYKYIWIRREKALCAGKTFSGTEKKTTTPKPYTNTHKSSFRHHFKQFDNNHNNSISKCNGRARTQRHWKLKGAEIQQSALSAMKCYSIQISFHPFKIHCSKHWCDFDNHWRAASTLCRSHQPTHK